MIRFIIGGKAQGKLEYVLSSEDININDVANCNICSFSEIKDKRVIYGYHHLIKRLLNEKIDPLEFTQNLITEHNDLIIISDEIGYGIVPMEKEDRYWREAVGRVCCYIAKEANEVTRIICGIPSVIKSNKNLLKVTLIRHGETLGNRNKKYIGITDESLTKEGRDKIAENVLNKIYPSVEKVFSSPLNRCKETANIIYKSKEISIREDLKETNFGDFENKSYEELKDNQSYIKWIDDNCNGMCPNGESRNGFSLRSTKEFELIIDENLNEDEIALVVHGGTIMAILEKYAKPYNDFYHYQVKNGEGYIISIDKDRWNDRKEVKIIEKIGDK